jgi:hypothetical protein
MKKGYPLPASRCLSTAKIDNVRFTSIRDVAQTSQMRKERSFAH